MTDKIKIKKQNLRRLVAAHHEAAHALIFLHAMCEAPKLTTIKNKKEWIHGKLKGFTTSGLTVQDYYVNHLTKNENLIFQIMISLAGKIGEIMFLPINFNSYYITAFDDLKDIKNKLLELNIPKNSWIEILDFLSNKIFLIIEKNKKIWNLLVKGILANKSKLSKTEIYYILKYNKLPKNIKLNNLKICNLLEQINNLKISNFFKKINVLYKSKKFIKLFLIEIIFDYDFLKLCDDEEIKKIIENNNNKFKKFIIIKNKLLKKRNLEILSEILEKAINSNNDIIEKKYKQHKQQKIKKMIKSNDLILYANGHLEIVEKLINAGNNVNFKNELGKSALHIASANGHLEIVEKLINANALINIQDNEGWTPLMLASENGHLEIVEKLINANALINIQDNEGWTALKLVSGKGHLEIVEKLINANALINIQDNEGWTALKLVSGKGHLEIVEKLINANALINIQDNEGWTPLMLASANGYLEIVEKLINAGNNVNFKNELGKSALHIASENGHLEIFEKLINANALINIQDNEGWTPLMLASANGYLEIVEKLINANALINIQDNEGWTPLMLASANGYLEIVEKLINTGNNVNFKNELGKSALHIASENGHLEIVEKLINANALINIQDNEGWTPLMLASANGYLEIVEKLIINKSNLHIKTKNKENILEKTFKGFYRTLFRININYIIKEINNKLNLNINNQEYNIFLKKYLIIIKILIENNIDMNKNTKWNWKILIYFINTYFNKKNIDFVNEKQIIFWKKYKKLIRKKNNFYIKKMKIEKSETKQKMSSVLGFEKDKSKINSEASTSKNQNFTRKSQKM